MSSGMMLAIVLAKTLFYPAAKVAVDRLYRKPGTEKERLPKSWHEQSISKYIRGDLKPK
jgi:hypothetical protein